MSCAENIHDEVAVNSRDIQNEEVYNMASDMNRFAEILSKAVNENVSLRCFLKEQALKMIDKDYDVFYPYVKNEMISEGKSFRDILLAHAAGEDELAKLEKNLPLLTIYVPELPSGFNAGTWDVANKSSLVAANVLKNDTISFYNNGIVELSLRPCEIPGFPTLVIKNNERIRIKNRCMDQ